MQMQKFCAAFLFLSQSAFAALPGQPVDPLHPGSNQYSYTLKQESFQLNKRTIDVFLPHEMKDQAEKAPVIVFGHGQAIDVEGYELTFEHLAKKGIAVIHPTYDSGFFDQDWRRMASDFNELTHQTLKKYSDYVDEDKIVYAGHSKGAYVALMAAGDPGLKRRVGALVLFAPAGFDAEYLKNLDTNIPVTLVWSDNDTIIKQSLITDIYAKLPSKYKQWILAKSYPSLKADHFFLLSKSYFFGGRNGVSVYHYHAVWKWLLGAAWDLENPLSNPYLYGIEAGSSGISGLDHQITRSW